MAFFSEIKARLGLDITDFEANMSRVQQTAKNTAKEFAKGMGGIKGLIGFGALAAGFNSALDKAQELRDAALETGTALNPAVARTAELADNLEKAKSKFADISIGTIGAINRGIEMIVAGYYGAFTNQDPKELLKKIDQGTNEDAIRQKENADNEKRRKVTIELNALRMSSKSISEQEGLVFKERIKLEGELKLIQFGSLEYKIKELETEKLINKETALKAKHEEAALKFAQANEAAKNFISDRSAATIAELEAGTRGSLEDRKKAAEVLRLEALAKEARDKNEMVSLRTASTTQVVNGKVVYGGGQLTGEKVSLADEYTRKALSIQNTIGALSSSERDPMASLNEALKTSNDLLTKIEKNTTLQSIN
jgi:hypothetical protein